MSDKKRKLLKQTSLLNFMCGTYQSKRRKTAMDEEQKNTDAALNRCDVKPTSSIIGSSAEDKYEMEDDDRTQFKRQRSQSPNSQDAFIPKNKPGSVNESNNTIRGDPIALLNSAPTCYKKLTVIKPSDEHTVLFELPFVYQNNKLPTPYPSHFKDGWNSNHVHMPCSKKNEYPAENERKIEMKNRWKLIEETYQDIIPGPYELEEAILSYNQRNAKKWSFETLRKYFTHHVNKAEREDFFGKVLPKIIDLALKLPHLCTKPIPLLKKHTNHSISMSQQQIACLLANAFLCTFPRRNSRHKGSEYANYPDINFTGLYKPGSTERKFEKLKCIIHYFERVTTNMPKGIVTFTRQYIPDTPIWEDSQKNVPNKLHVSSSGTIEDDGFGLLQVDFANKFIGGGVLGHGCVQEEIRFLISPEMIITRLFTEVLDDKECLIMKGCERFSNYNGYADSFEWKENHEDQSQRDINGRLCTDVVAIDALIIHKHSDQFGRTMLQRELNKAYVGFEICDKFKVPADCRPAVCTGNWGCGAFRGDKQLKALIQLMAAGQAKRDVCYFTFGDSKLTKDIYEMYKYLKEQQTEIRVLMCLVMEFRKQVLSCRRKIKFGLFAYLFEKLEGVNHSESEEEKEEEYDQPDIHDSSNENSLQEPEDNNMDKKVDNDSVAMKNMVPTASTSEENDGKANMNDHPITDTSNEADL